MAQQEHYIGPEHQLDTLSVDEMLPQTAEKAVEDKAEAEAEQRQTLVEARQSIAASQTIKNPLENLQDADEPADAPQNVAVSRQLESIALNRELKNLRRHLGAPQRALSKVVHQKAVRVTSEAAAKTISRPSGLLGGGFMAFVGSLVYLYLARHYGFRYNYLLFGLLFLGGFAVGLGLEVLVWLARRRR